MLGLGSLDLAIIAAYFGLSLAVGLWLRRRASQSADDYFLGGRRIPWWVIGASGTASNFDMTGTMVITAFVFALGLQGFWVAMRGGMCLPLGLLLAFMGAWLRRSRVMTTAEWMELRFGPGPDGQAARLLSAVSNLVVTVAFLTYFVKGVGKFLAVFLPWSPTTCALILVVVALVYTAMSGLYGVIYTDVLQEGLLLVVSVFLGVKAMTLPDHAAVLGSAGGDWASWAPRWTAAPMPWLADPTLYQMFGLCVIFWIARGLLEGASGFTGGYMPQRYYAARSERDAGLLTAEWVVLLLVRWGLVVGAALLALSLSRSSGAIAARLAADPEQALPVVIGNALPAGLRGVAVAGLIAAAMSTFDSTVNAGAAYWVKDIYQRWLRPAAAERALVRQGYLATAGLTVVALVIALSVPNIDSIWRWITGPLSAGLFAPLLLRWYWWRLTGWGFALATAVGLVVSIGLQLAAPQLPLYVGFPATWGASLAAGLIGSWLTPATPRATLRAFWERIRPFGRWRPVLGDVDPALRVAARAEHRRTLLTTPSAVLWHVSGVVGIIAAVLHQWGVLLGALGTFVGLGVLLWEVWYRHLPRADAPVAPIAGSSDNPCDSEPERL